MEVDQTLAPDVDLQTQSILLAASQHDCSALRKLLRGSSSSPANVQDPETGFTPLHAAIAACEPEEKDGVILPNGGPKDPSLTSRNTSHVEIEGEPQLPSTSEEEEAAADTLRLLLQNGAIWNELDKNSETPGCLALRLGLKKLYEIMVDAGVRAEMLLNRLDEYERLNDDDDEEVTEDEGLEQTTQNDGAKSGAQSDIDTNSQPQEELAESDSLETPIEGKPSTVSSEAYLKSNLTFGAERMLDEEKNGVMMVWETEIMRRTAQLLAPAENLRILNIGHGMGIIDGFFQAKPPTCHHIIEAHPEVISKMKKDGWHDKPGVTVHEGKWQDIVPKLMEEGILFDAIYFDTFAEDYTALKKLFDEYIIGLLDDNGKWSFFNGLGADRQICYDVYAKVVEMDLLEAGFDVDWETLNIPNLDDSKTWAGLKRPYWKSKEYKLPVITFLG